MHAMTVANLRSAFAAESQAHMRYLVYAKAAESEGLDNIARLFRAIAASEEIHASNHFKQLRGDTGKGIVGSYTAFGLAATVDNLDVAIGGEVFEIAEMYPVYKAAAIFQEETSAERSFHWAWQSEQTHAPLFKRAKEAAEAGKDMDLAAIYVCDVCGHTVTGAPLPYCPICGAPREHYIAFP